MRTTRGSTGGASDPLQVRGGAAGTAVGVASLEAAAGVLADVARALAGLAWRVAVVAADPDLVAGSVLSPVTGAHADAALAVLAGPRGLTGEVTRLLSLAAGVVAAAEAYREAEAAATRAVERAQDTVMFVVGRLAPELVVGSFALDAMGIDVVGLLDEALFDVPEIADLGGGAEGLVLGLGSNRLSAPFVREPPATDGLTSEQDYERGVRTIAESAAPWGWLSDRGRARVSPENTPRPGARVPRNLEQLVADQVNLSDGEGYAGHVRVIEVPQAQGSAWIVEVSGTQVWDPQAGANLYDLTTDLHSMAQDTTLLADAVQQALEQAQASSSSSVSSASSPRAAADAVMLVGHSLGGIAAAGLATSPRFTQAHRVTHVVTMGSPVGRIPVAEGIEVLSLEHVQDAVPRLEGQRNPDRATWVTVTRDLQDEGLDRASQAHDSGLYVDTAACVDASTDPSVAGWRTTSASFFAGNTHGEAVIRDYAIERVVP